MGGSLGKPRGMSSERNLSHDELVDKLRYTPLTNKEENTKAEAYYCGYITCAEARIPEDPQLFAAGTPDPYAPFAFNHGIQWESYYYDDGTIYEGTMIENFPHGNGLLSVGYVGGGGLTTGATGGEMQFGDLYEGEFNTGFVHGMGKYVNRNGFMYTGEFMAGMKHGCGELKDLSPYLRLVQAGIDPLKSWEISALDIEKETKRGTWLNDRFSAVPDNDGADRACTFSEIAGVVEEADEVANRARMFRYKPDGMAQIFYQDAKGIPVRTLQDPLHYPYGTTFLAPGPIAQMFPIPEDSTIKGDIYRAQCLWRSIYDRYNFDPDPDPDRTFTYVLDKWAQAEFERQLKDRELAKSRHRRHRYHTV